MFSSVRVLLFIGLMINACQTSDSANKSMVNQAAIFSSPKPGHYTGYLRTSAAATKIPVSFELIPLSNKGNLTIYRGHFKLSNGTHDGHEYASYNFEDTSYNPTTKSLGFLTLNGMTSMTLTFKTAEQSSGTIRISTGQDAELFLVHENDATSDLIAKNIFPDLQEAKTLTGEYIGTCEGSAAVLEVEAVKTRGHSPDDAGELSGYSISGRFGQNDGDTCKTGAPCFKKFYREGSFNLLNRKLVLKDEKSSLECTLKIDELTCGTCKLVQQKDSVYSILAGTDKEKVKPASMIKEKGSKFESRQGQYYGYVHNAKQNTYQLIAINIFDKDESSGSTPNLAENSAANDVTTVNGVATLYFGDGDSNEYIAYRMKQATVDKVDQRFFWDSDGEIILKILNWKADYLVGDWISKAYGRVGNFMVKKGAMPQMSSAVTILPVISGVYTSDEWEFEIAAYSELSENSQEIYPLNSYGWAKEKTPHARRRIVKKVNYDFYSGIIALNLDDGRTIIGRTGNNAMTMLWWPRVNYGATFSPIKPIKFEKISEKPTPQARIFPK